MLGILLISFLLFLLLFQLGNLIFGVLELYILDCHQGLELWFLKLQLSLKRNYFVFETLIFVDNGSLSSVLQHDFLAYLTLQEGAVVLVPTERWLRAQNNGLILEWIQVGGIVLRRDVIQFLVGKVVLHKWFVVFVWFRIRSPAVIFLLLVAFRHTFSLRLWSLLWLILNLCALIIRVFQSVHLGAQRIHLFRNGPFTLHSFLLYVFDISQWNQVIAQPILVDVWWLKILLWIKIIGFHQVVFNVKIYLVSLHFETSQRWFYFIA